MTIENKLTEALTAANEHQHMLIDRLLVSRKRIGHYRHISYPESVGQELRVRYESLADTIEAAATEPIAIVWAHDHEDWTDKNGFNPERNCLLVTQHIEESDTECGFGLNLSTHRLYQ